jgi:hypothetical protein
MSNKRSSDKQPKIKASDLEGLKDLRAIAKLLERLHKVGTVRDTAKNRDLHMDQYCLLVLMWLYNPILSSMRGLQEASNLKEVQKRLGVGRASLGSLSESVSVFDPEPLAALAEELGQKLPDRTPVNFSAVDKRITAVDGSVFKVLSQIAKLAWIPIGDGKHRCGYRLHTQFEVFRGTPSRIDLTPANPKGPSDERVVLEKTLESERCYLLDRGYEKYALWNTIHAKESQYVCRIRDNPTFEVLENRPLSEQAAKENILCDQIVAALYLLRWTIELYFRMIKQLLGCRHLLSHKPNGVTIQIYLAIIACIMIMSITGKSPTKRTYEMISFYLIGWATLDELEEHIKKLSDKVA